MPAVTVMVLGSKSMPIILTSFADCVGVGVDVDVGVEAHPGRRPITIPTRAIAIAAKMSLFLLLIAMILHYQAAGSARNTIIPITWR